MVITCYPGHGQRQKTMLRRKLTEEPICFGLAAFTKKIKIPSLEDTDLFFSWLFDRENSDILDAH